MNPGDNCGFMLVRTSTDCGPVAAVSQVYFAITSDIDLWLLLLLDDDETAVRQWLALSGLE